MNILWIEDFGGGLSSGTESLKLFFQDFVDFDQWDEDALSLLSRPSDLQNFCNQIESCNCIYLCRNYFDYEEVKKNFDILSNIDIVIIDIRLDNNIDLDRPIPDWIGNKSKFHEEGGFYIFNDLVHFGFPSEKICLMTGESGKLDFFDKRRSEIYFPKAKSFIKSKDEAKLRDWLKAQNTDYANLRRSVIDGCKYLRQLIEQDEDNIQFRHFIKIENIQPAIEIPTNEIKNYLDVLIVSLDIREPTDGTSLNNRYRLFLRALSHEWEENIEANSLKQRHANDLSNIRDIYTFAWIMKMTRNWVAHAKLLEPLNAQFISFLFLINMRAMFKLSKAIQPYERMLLGLISAPLVEQLDAKKLNRDIAYAEQIADENLSALRIEAKKYSDKAKEKVEKHFGEKINDIYRQVTGNPDAEPYDFQQFLFQYFWINQKKQLRKLIDNSDEFLPTLARRIYHYSFPEA